MKNDNTPYHVLHSLRNKYKTYDNKPQCDYKEWEDEIVLIKFDDGWRVKKN